MSVRHVVAWKLATDDDAERARQSQEIVTRLQALVGVVPSLQAASVGADAAEGNWDAVLIADFADREGLAAYAVHPEHQKVAAYIRSVISDRVAVDFEV